MKPHAIQRRVKDRRARPRVLKSLNARFLAWLVPTFAISFAALVGVHEWLAFRNAETQLRSHLDKLAASQSIILAELVAKRDTERLELLLATIISDRDVVGIAVYDDESRELDSFGVLAPTRDTLVKRISINFADADGIRRVGELRISMSLQRILGELRQRLFQQALLGLALLVTGVIGAAVANRRIVVKPLARLLAAVQESKGGALVLAADRHGNDELGQLITAYNDMQARLTRHDRELRRSKARFENLFQTSEVSVWNLDLTAVHDMLQSLRDEGVEDLRTHLAAFDDLAREMTAKALVLDVNDATVELFGAEGPADLRGPIQLTLGRQGTAIFIDLVCAIWTGSRVFRAETVFRTLNGRKFDAIVTFPIPQTRDGFASIPMTIVDISERKQAEAKLLAAKLTAEEASKAKSEFLASMSHELRTPLNAVLGFAQMLRFDTRTPLTKAQDEYVESILTGGNHLLDLVNDVLDLARIEADNVPITMEVISANGVVSECSALTALLAEPNSISIIDRFSSQPDVYVCTDRMRLKQILINLLSNGVKFNEPGGTVTIDAWKTSDGFLHVDVTDTGIGIPAKDHGHVFQMFHRFGADPTQAREGTGIGLAVTKLLVERMGGRISFESQENVGSTFWIELPVA